MKKKLITLVALICLIVISVPVINTYADQTVFITATGSKYHTTDSCRGLNKARNIYAVTLSEAQQKGLEPCSICSSIPAPTPVPDPTPTPAPIPIPSSDVNPDSNLLNMFRMYNPNSGEHFYTSNITEGNILVQNGWTYEGVAWTAPATSSTPVYRLFNPYSSEHHYTTGELERDTLIGYGWNYEGIGWYSDDNQGVTLHRLYNPNAVGQYAAGAHHYTKDFNEVNVLSSSGWNYEGVGWYGK